MCQDIQWGNGGSMQIYCQALSVACGYLRGHNCGFCLVHRWYLLHGLLVRKAQELLIIGTQYDYVPCDIYLGTRPSETNVPVFGTYRGVLERLTQGPLLAVLPV